MTFDNNIGDNLFNFVINKRLDLIIFIVNIGYMVCCARGSRLPNNATKLKY